MGYLDEINHKRYPYSPIGGYGNNMSNGGSLFTPMNLPTPTPWNYNPTQFQMSQAPEYSKPQEYKPMNPYLAGGLGLLGFGGLMGSIFGGPAYTNTAAFARDEAGRFNQMGDEYRNMNNQFVKTARNQAMGQAYTGAQNINNNLNKQFASQGFGGRSSNALAKQGSMQAWNTGIDQANSAANSAYQQSLNFANSAYDRARDYNNMWLQGEEQKRLAGAGRQNALGDIASTFLGQGIGGFLGGIFG